MVFIPTGETICPTLYSCPTDGEFYEDREGWSTRQVFLGDSVPDMPVYCCEDFELGRPCDCRDSFLDEEEQVEF